MTFMATNKIKEHDILATALPSQVQIWRWGTGGCNTNPFSNYWL